MRGVAYTDGASRGNPGPAAAGFLLQDETGRHLLARAYFLGRATNNVAEYTAVIRALEAAETIGISDLTLYTDSELVVRQLEGRYKVKSDLIQPLVERVQKLQAGFASCVIMHVTRDKNSQADRLVNKALDAGEDVEESVPVAASRPPSTECRVFQKRLRLGVLLSGGGRTMLNILESIRRGELNAEIALVISSLSTVAGVARARNAGLPVKVVRRKDHPDLDAFSARLQEELSAAGVDLVVQGGWLCLWKIPAQYENRVMNIHPALLPSFGGRGMWGHHVHEAVLAAGCKVSGCTVHFCTNEYDRGPIIIQRTCPVLDDDTPETLAERVFEQECLAYPEAIRLFAEGRLQIEGNRVKIGR